MSALQNLLRRWLKLPGDPTPPAPPHRRPRRRVELIDKLDRYGFDVEAHALANGWWR